MSASDLTAEQLEELKKRHIRSYVLRRGHISQAQQRALEEIFPCYELVYAHDKLLDAEQLFGRKAPLVLEIGCGMGETTAAIAQAHPEINFLGCEVFAAGIGALSKLIEEKGLQNIRICRHDAIEVVRDMIAENSLAGVHIYFPDPWRKARHHKRRLIRPDFVSLLAARIAQLYYNYYLHTSDVNYLREANQTLADELRRYLAELATVRSNTAISREVLSLQRTPRTGCPCFPRQYALATCGHTFCSACYASIMSHDTLACPHCQAPFTCADIIVINYSTAEEHSAT